MNFLLIETASSNCSVATANENGIISIRENADGREHAALVTVFADEAMKESKLIFRHTQNDNVMLSLSKHIDAVVVSAGPGSYTGLRIGMSAAKGICYAANLPLIAVETLEALASGFVQKHLQTTTNHEPRTTICSVFDARRDEVYYGIWTAIGETIISSRAALLNEDFKNTISTIEGKIYFVGDGAKKVNEFLGDTKSSFHPEFKTSAQHLLSIAIKKFNEKDFADVAYFEPNYIKPFYFAEKKV